MRRCLDCDATLKDFEMKCSICGSENLTLIEDNQTKYKESKPKGALILFIVVIIIGLVSSIVISNNANKIVPAKPIKTAIVSLYSGDIQGYIDQMYGGFKSDAENFFTDSYGDFEIYKKDTEEILKNAFGNQYKITSKAIDVYSYSDKMIDFYQQTCDDLNYDIQIEDIKHITVRVSIENDEGAQEYYVADEYSVQVGGKWYFLPKDMLVFDEE